MTIERKPSHRKSAKTDIVAFKVEAELARLLDQLPNKSAFIRKAILQQLNRKCPLCMGQGVVPDATHQRFAALLQSAVQRPCDECGVGSGLLHDPGDLFPADRARLEQFFLGGPFYCARCYEQAPLCGECGWHIARECLPDHLRHTHSGKN